GNSMLYGTNASGVKGWYAQPSGGGSGANPTALVGLTAVNGVATTFLRSDGAPALDVSIAPTWTGAHNFAATAGVPLTVTSTAAGVGAQLNTSATIAPPAGINALYVNGSALTATLGNGAANVMAAPSGGVGSIYQRPDAVAVAGVDLWLQRTTTASALEEGATIRYSDTTSGYSGTEQFTKTGTNTCQFEWWEYAGTSWSKVASLDQGGNLSLAGGLGLHGSAPPAKVTGWGTPTGATLVANFAGGSATLAQTSEVVAYILTTLKLMGIYGG
ncbi:MAG: hypothetical protein KGL39_42700, partial [Patescibacteria group bacterium]|nr:hypothetical protein [Patescibacteria group bacterium]